MPLPPPEGRSRRFHSAALLAAMVFPVLAAWTYFDAAAGSGWIRILYPVSKVVQFSFPLIWVLGVERRRLRLRAPGRRELAEGIGVGVAIVALILSAYFGFFKGSACLGETPERLRMKIQDMGVGTSGRYIALAAFISLLHSFLEEYYWRWFVYGELRRRWAVPWALPLASLAFMAHHVIILNAYIPSQYFWSVTLFFSASVAAGGAAWAWLYERWGGIGGAWLSHILVDAAILVIGYDLIWGL